MDPPPSSHSQSCFILVEHRCFDKSAHIALLQQARVFAHSYEPAYLYAAISKRTVDKETVERFDTLLPQAPLGGRTKRSEEGGMLLLWLSLTASTS